MTSQISAPLVGPLTRRGVRQLLRFAPLTRNPSAALVIMRRGRLVDVIPAGSRRTLADYFDWPFDVREVDMRERLLVIARQCESAEPGFNFALTLQITYQVVRPDHVALAHADVLAELTEAIDQRARAVALTLNVEQVGALKEYLVEALTIGNELPQRFVALGLAFRRADVAVELGSAERARADTVKDQTRDRPLLARFRVPTRDPEHSFDTQVGGFYRLRSRHSTQEDFDAAEVTLYDVVSKALNRVGLPFPPEEYRAASAAMTDALWNDGVLKAELSASGLELLRPAVHIYPDRELLALLGRPLLLDDGRTRDRQPRRLGAGPRLAIAAPREQPAARRAGEETFPQDASPLEGEVVEQAAASEEGVGPGWRTLFSSDSEPAAEYDLSDTESGGLDLARTTELQNDSSVEAAPPDFWWSLSDDAPTWLESATSAGEETVLEEEPDDEPERVTEELVITEVARAVAAQAPEVAAVPPLRERAAGEDAPAEAPGHTAEDVAIEEPPLERERAVGEGAHAWIWSDENDVRQEPAVPPASQPHEEPLAPPPDQRVIERWVRLLHTSGPAMLKLWTFELADDPGQLPAILRHMTDDIALLAPADDPAAQRALLEALSRPAPPPPAAPAVRQEEDLPDWMRLRETAVDEAEGGSSRRGGAQ
ncbi:MAG: hypothetical protein RLZZ387_3346 [Chloroflexota bacterium]|jgi:hypothetical protein